MHHNQVQGSLLRERAIISPIPPIVSGHLFMLEVCEHRSIKEGCVMLFLVKEITETRLRPEDDATLPSLPIRLGLVSVPNMSQRRYIHLPFPQRPIYAADLVRR